MLDRHLHPRIKPLLNRLVATLDKPGITPDGITLMGFAIGVLALPFLALGWYLAALVAIALNRLLDGLDGALARRRGLSDAGGFLDIPSISSSMPWCPLALPWRIRLTMRCLPPGCCLPLSAPGAVFWRLLPWPRSMR